MIEQFVGVGDVLYVKQFHQRVFLRVEVVVHVFEYRLDAYLTTVTYRPYRVERQSFRHSTLKDKHRRCSRTRDEVNALRVKIRDGLGEHRVVPASEQTDAVGSYKRTAVAVADVEDALLKGGTFLRLLSEASRDDDERAHLFLRREILHIVGTETRRHNEDGKVGGRHLLHVVKHLDALHLVLLGIHYAQRSLETSAYEVAHYCSTWLMAVVRATYNHNTLWL